jgi:hypothetical protein
LQYEARDATVTEREQRYVVATASPIRSTKQSPDACTRRDQVSPQQSHDRMIRSKRINDAANFFLISLARLVVTSGR